MSAIFKHRRIPRHLIIEDDYERRHRPKRSWRLLSVGLVMLVLAYGFMLMRSAGVLV